MSIEIFRKYFSQQRKNIANNDIYGRMSFEDIKRVEKNIQGDIFSNECCSYKGEITNKNYLTISFNGIKVSVLRLLYHNYIDDITENHILTYKCKNRSLCCCLNHLGCYRRI